MKLNLYKHLKLAAELADAANTNHATHLEHKSLDALLDLISTIRQLQEESNVKPSTISSNRTNSDIFGSTLGYERDSRK